MAGVVLWPAGSGLAYTAMKPYSATHRSSSGRQLLVSGASLMIGNCAAPTNRVGNNWTCLWMVSLMCRHQVGLDEAHGACRSGSKQLHIDVELVDIPNVRCGGLQKVLVRKPRLGARARREGCGCRSIDTENSRQEGIRSDRRAWMGVNVEDLNSVVHSVPFRSRSRAWPGYACAVRSD